MTQPVAKQLSAIYNHADVQLGFALPLFKDPTTDKRSEAWFLQDIDQNLRVVGFTEVAAPQCDDPLLITCTEDFSSTIGNWAIYAFIDTAGLISNTPVILDRPPNLRVLFQTNLGWFHNEEFLLPEISSFVYATDLCTTNQPTGFPNADGTTSWRHFTQICINDQRLPFSYIPYPFRPDTFNGELPPVYRKMVNALKAEVLSTQRQSDALRDFQVESPSYHHAVTQSEIGAVPLINLMWETPSRNQAHTPLIFGELFAFAIIIPHFSKDLEDTFNTYGAGPTTYDHVLKSWKAHAIDEKEQAYCQDAIGLNLLIDRFEARFIRLCLQADGAIREKVDEQFDLMEVSPTSSFVRSETYTDFGNGLKNLYTATSDTVMIAEWSDALSETIRRFPSTVAMNSDVATLIREKDPGAYFKVFKGYFNKHINASYMLPTYDWDYASAICKAAAEAYLSVDKSKWSDDAQDLLDNMLVKPVPLDSFKKQVEKFVHFPSVATSQDSEV